MVQASGFMLTAKLTAGPVGNNGTAVIRTADASNPNLDTVNWQIVANGKIYVAPEVQVAFGDTFINVTNRTGLTWPQHSEVVFCTPYKPSATELERTVADHETRITNLENAAGVTSPDTLPA